MIDAGPDAQRALLLALRQMNRPWVILTGIPNIDSRSPSIGTVGAVADPGPILKKLLFPGQTKCAGTISVRAMAPSRSAASAVLCGSDLKPSRLVKNWQRGSPPLLSPATIHVDHRSANRQRCKDRRGSRYWG